MRIICLNAWGGMLYNDLLAYLATSGAEFHACRKSYIPPPAPKSG